MVLGLFGSLLDDGGIERMNRAAGAVLQEVAQSHGEACQLLSLNDGPGPMSFELNGRRHSGTGFGRRKAKFATQALRLSRPARIAYIGHPNFGVLALALRLVNPRLRYWVATYGTDVWEPLGPLTRLALRRAEGVIAISRHTLERLIEVQDLDPTKIVLLPPGLDPGLVAAEPDDRDAASTGEPGLVLTVCRLRSIEAGKGVDTVIRALPRVLQAAPQASFVVIGGGDQRASLEGLAEQMGVRSKVVFAGRVEDRELKSYYQKAEVFVLPSRQEGFGIVFLEAMAFAKPVIGGDVGGTPDIVVDGETGFLVKHGDVDTLANRLISLLQDADLRRRMGVAGRRRLEENYTFDRFRERLSDLLDGQGSADV